MDGDGPSLAAVSACDDRQVKKKKVNESGHHLMGMGALRLKTQRHRAGSNGHQPYQRSPSGPAWLGYIWPLCAAFSFLRMGTFSRIAVWELGLTTKECRSESF